MLVVIAIISILIGIGVNTFTIAQKKARDTKRKADLANIQKALIAYGIDHNGSYCPGAAATCTVLSVTPGFLTTNYLSAAHQQQQQLIFTILAEAQLTLLCGLSLKTFQTRMQKPTQQIHLALALAE